MNGINLSQCTSEPGSSLKVPSFSIGISQVLEGPILSFTGVPLHTTGVPLHTQETLDG